ncbi:MAG: hypothetical protein L3J09_05560 [Flavobacteriaceae bacterium]|nr:hypothetical protein [Flavobacteriaceae bacterium]
MNKHFLHSIFLFLATFRLVSAQEKDVIIDRSKTSTREFTTYFPEEYSNLDYSVETGQSQNYLLRFIRWFFDFIAELFGINVDPEMYKTVEILIYFILIIIAIVIISKLFLKSNTTSFFSKKSKNLAPISFEEEHIEQIDLEALISNALAQSDYRLAIRYMYLKVLKNLSLNNLINWHFDKTNIDYQNELTSQELKKQFGTVSYLYDHIWYGEFGLDEEGFRKAKNEFDQLSKSINSHG